MDSSRVWLSSKLTISKFPSVEDVQDGLYDSYQFRINVSDMFNPDIDKMFSEMGVASYWLPCGESYGMPLENIYAAMLLLWRAERDNKRVLLHCIAGRNRSRMIHDCYRYMVTGKYDEDSAMMLNVFDNQLPGIYRLEVFLQKCFEVFNNPEIADGAFIDWIKKETFGF